ELGAGRDRGRVGEYGDPPRLRDVFMQDFESFHVELRGEDAHPGGIAAWPRQAGREPATDHIIGHADDRDGLSRALDGPDARVAEGDNEIYILRDELTGQCRGTLAPALRPNELEADVASLFPADRLHVAAERVGEGLHDILRIEPQHADHRQVVLLCPRRQRPRRRRAADSQDELAPFHSITSLALERKSGEMAMPRARAVRRLITKSNFDASSIGSSPALVPRRIRATYPAARRKLSGMFGP